MSLHFECIATPPVFVSPSSSHTNHWPVVDWVAGWQAGRQWDQYSSSAQNDPINVSSTAVLAVSQCAAAANLLVVPQNEVENKERPLHSAKITYL